MSSFICVNHFYHLSSFLSSLFLFLGCALNYYSYLYKFTMRIYFLTQRKGKKKKSESHLRSCLNNVYFPISNHTFNVLWIPVQLLNCTTCTSNARKDRVAKVSINDEWVRWVVKHNFVFLIHRHTTEKVSLIILAKKKIKIFMGLIWNAYIKNLAIWSVGIFMWKWCDWLNGQVPHRVVGNG